MRSHGSTPRTHKSSWLKAIICAGGLTHAPAVLAEPNLIGQTGLIHMPDARVEEEGTLRFGAAQTDPYFSVWSSISFFPRLELSGRYIKIDGVPGFSEAPELGDYRDKAFDAKLVLLNESGLLPNVAVGAQDYIGTRLFPARYLALSKRIGDWDLTAGYGQRRIDGAFGGVRYRPAGLAGWNFAVEYDANDYARDFRAAASGAGQRTGGITYAVGYDGGWWGTQVSYQHGDMAGNLYLSIPLMQPEFVPKLDEPPPYDTLTERASLDQWRGDSRYMLALAQALARQGYSDIRIGWQGEVLELTLTQERISLIGRAVGRAARTALRLGPRDMVGLRITYTLNEQPLVTYDFHDPAVLERYLGGAADRAALEAAAEIRYASVDVARRMRHETALPGATDEAWPVELSDGALVRLRPPAGPLAGFGLLPFNVRVFFNDPGAPVRYDTFAVGTYSRRLSRGLYLNGAARLTLYENVSDIRQPSTSLLPHVRSDIGEYRRQGDDLRLNSLLLNQYLMLRERMYARFSAGYYEEMYAGAGGQWLYLPRRGDWALDVAVDALRQRAPGEAFGFRDYSVVTTLASLHYRFPGYGVTATARAGRFLARDEGVRFELKRRFRSGIEMGAWYTWTNARDVTNPGTPDNPYRDKGLFVSIPLNTLLTQDTQERANMAMADYTRDVGQMAASPGDLYRLVERALVLDSGAHDPLTDFTR